MDEISENRGWDLSLKGQINHAVVEDVANEIRKNTKPPLQNHSEQLATDRIGPLSLTVQSSISRLLRKSRP